MPGFRALPTGLGCLKGSLLGLKTEPKADPCPAVSRAGGGGGSDYVKGHHNGTEILKEPCCCLGFFTSSNLATDRYIHIL